MLPATSAGLPVPVHLAVNLLGLFAAAGLALVVRRRDGAGAGAPAAPRSVSGTLVAAGAAAVALAHAIDGAFLPDRAVAVAWLVSGGLASVAAGLSPGRVPALRGASPGPALASPPGRGRAFAALALPLAAAAGLALLVVAPGALAPPVALAPPAAAPALAPPVAAPAALVGLAAGLLAAGRALLAGGRLRLLGLGLALWGAAQLLAGAAPRLGAAATLGGALAVVVWVWTASADRLQAKLVSAFVATLLAVVVVVAAVLSTLGAAALAREELDSLASASAEIASEVGRSWPREAVERARLLTLSADTLARFVEHSDEAGLRDLLRSVPGQDVLAVLDAHGQLLLAAAEVGALAEEPSLAAFSGSVTVSRLLDGQPEAGEVLRVAGHVVALGGVRVFGGDGVRAEDPPRFLVLTGRVADDVWASQASARLPFDVVLEAGGSVHAASDRLSPVTATRLLAGLGEDTAAAVAGDDGLVFVASAPLADPETLEPLGRVVAVRSGEVLAQLDRDQARQLFLIALLGTVVAAVIGAVASGRLVAPLRRLTAAAAAVGQGRLDARARVGSRDEVGMLGRAFDDMAASLQEQSARLRQAAQVQERLRARLQALHTSMSDALVAVDLSGRVVTFNPAAERLLGREADGVLGLPLEAVLAGRAPDGRSPAQALGPPDGQHPATVRLVLDGAGERPVPTAATAAPVREDSGDVLGRVLVLRDVTRETEVERMKAEFLANVSHELRTPLTPVKGYADILHRRDVDDEARRKYAGQILESTARLERVVAMIVEFAAFDAGQVRPELEPADVASVVKQAVEQWAGRAEGRSFGCALADDLPAALVDVAMLRRCLDELLDNAVKFSPGGEPVDVSARRLEEAGTARLRLSVADCGVGIERERLGAVFGDFYQADGGVNRLFGGLGLGLALVQRMVTAMGADAAVESVPGQGATFHLYLPVAEPGPPSSTLESQDYNE